MKLRKLILSTAVLVATLVGAAAAQTSPASAISIQNPWSRATPAGSKTAIAYMTIVNDSAQGDHLLSASTPVAQAVQFHVMSQHSGIMTMRDLASIEVKPRARVELKPSGMHAMLIGLKQLLKQGQTFPLTLVFQKAGKVEVTIPVASVGAQAAPDMTKMPGMVTPKSP